MRVLAHGSRMARLARTTRTAAGTATRTPRAAAGLAAVLAITAIVLLLTVAAPFGPAYAAETSDNLVDPTQRADNSFIYDTTIETLFDQSSLYDDRTVQITGEVIGDRIEAEGHPGYCWIMLTMIESEDKASISILMSDELAGQIDRYGKYGVTGTILQVRGTYHQACGEHDGLPDIHASNTSVLTRGYDHPDEFVANDFLPGIVTVLVGLALMGAFYFARERTR